jgi:HlyD family secretion protein
MKRAFITIFILLILALMGAMGKYFYDQNKKDPVVYETEKPFIDNVLMKTVATGSIMPEREVQVKAQISGVIEEIYVQAGQSVKKGQLVARIRVIPDEANLQSALDRVKSSELDYKAKEAERKRQEVLLGNGVIAEQTYTEFRVSAELAEQNLNAAKSTFEVIRDGASSRSKSAANLVRSTATGMILDVPVKEGNSAIQSNNFNDGTTIISVADMSSMIFEGQVDESEVGKLEEGMILTLTVGAIEEETFEATLDFISPKGITEEGTIKFEIRADVQLKENAFIRAGYSANADIVLESRDSVVIIKESLLQFSGDTAYVEIQKGDQEFERREIELGISDGINVEILAGVDTTTAIKVPILE